MAKGQGGFRMDTRLKVADGVKSVRLLEKEVVRVRERLYVCSREDEPGVRAELSKLMDNLAYARDYLRKAGIYL